MDLGAYDPKNPYFKHDIDKICGVCTKKLGNGNIHSLEKEILPHESVKAYEVLANISNFKMHDNGPRLLCATCYINTTSAYKFQKLCNRAQTFFENFISHQEFVIEEKKKCNEDNTMEEITMSISMPDTIDKGSEEVESKIHNTHKTRKSPKKVKCKVCHKMVRADNINVHMRIHTGEKPYKCTYCDAAFSQWSSLRYHTEAHENKREFVCKYCGARFNSSIRLVAHERSHSGERPHQCKDCDLAFVTKDRLKSHIVVHTKEKPYTCEYCAKSYNRRSTLRVHLKIHTGDRPHVCHICGKDFIQRQSLKSHLHTHTAKNTAHAEMGIVTVTESATINSGEEFVVGMLDHGEQSDNEETLQEDR